MPFFLITIGGVLLFYQSHYFPFTSGGIVLAVSTFFILRKRPLPVLLLFLVIAWSGAWEQAPLEPFSCTNVIVEAKSTSLSMQSLYGYYYKGTITGVDGCRSDVVGRKATFFSREPVLPSTRILFTGNLKGTRSSRNPYDLTAQTVVSGTVQRYHEQVPVNGITRSIGLLRRDLRNAFQREFSPRVSSFLSTIILGERSLLPDTVRHSFSVTGLAHLLAISGTHFGVFSILVFWAAKLAVTRLPYPVMHRVTLYLKPSDAAALISIPFMLFYLLLSGMGTPAVRSFFMINVVLLGILSERQPSWKRSLAFAGAVILIISPVSITEPSFLLSFSSVAVIGAVMEWRGFVRSRTMPIPDYAKTIRDRIGERTGALAFLTGAALIGTIPLSMYLFHSVPVLSFPVNLIITPFVCFILVPIALVSSFFYILTGLFPFVPFIDALSSFTLNTVELISRAPFVNIPVPAFPPALVLLAYTGIALIFFSKKRVTGIILLSLFLCLVITYPLVRQKPLFEIAFLDTGQAESAVMTMPDGKIFVVDTGRTGKETSRYLDYLGAVSIDAVFLSHGGIDHAGGSYYLFLTKHIRDLFDNGNIRFGFKLPEEIRHRPLKRGDSIKGTGYTIETLHPRDGFVSSAGTENDNNSSLVLRLEIDGVRFLFTGDIEEEAEYDLLSLGRYLETDLIKVAHHGSRTSSTERFLALSGPSTGIISSGEFNMYGHPHREVLARLEELNLYNTAEQGAIKASVFPAKNGPSLFISSFDGTCVKRALTFGDELHNLKRIFTIW